MEPKIQGFAVIVKNARDAGCALLKNAAGAVFFTQDSDYAERAVTEHGGRLAELRYVPEDRTDVCPCCELAEVVREGSFWRAEKSARSGLVTYRAVPA